MNISRSSARRLLIFALLLLALTSGLTLPCLSVPYSSSPVYAGAERVNTRTARTRANEAYGNLPLSFEANEGQADSQVKFLSRGSRHTLFLTQTEAVLALIKPSTVKSDDGSRASVENLNKQSPSPGDRQTSLRMKLPGSNRSARVTGVDQLQHKSNYFTGNDPKSWRTGVANYAKVHYSEVYPGIDMVYYGEQGQLEYDFIVAPGADPRVIKLAFEGAQKMRVDGRGDLVLRTAVGVVRQRKPFVYQEVDKVRKQVRARYIVGANNVVSIKLAGYDKNRPLIIDPVLVYSTYLGGTHEDVGLSLAVDSAGNAYVTGVTHSMDFPTTPGAFKTSTETMGLAFVTKLNPSGTAPVYSTYLGSGDGNDIAVDSEGNVYVAGTTGSPDYPTTENAFDRTYNGGGGDAFVTKLNATGSALIYSTYVGATRAEQCRSVAIDSAGNAYITGLTISPDYPITPGALQSEFRGGRESFCAWGDAYITKINPSGTGLVYSTFLGGTQGESCSGVAVDSEGNAYVGGTTDSADFPVTQGAAQTVYGGCLQRMCGLGICQDVFVTKINANGTGMIYSTYIGGLIGEILHDLAIDSSGRVYVTGSTTSSNFPTANPMQATYGGFRDAFITKLNETGSAFVFSTYLGRSADDEGAAVAVDSSGNACVTGHTTSPNFPVINPLQSFGGIRDGFVTKFNPTGSMTYSTFLGGSKSENVFDGGIAVDASGGIYVTGRTQSTDFPTTPGAFQTMYHMGFDSGFNDAYVAKISDAFDICLQDQSGGSLLRINSDTGQYQLDSCNGFSLAGTGRLTSRGCMTMLEDTRPDRRVRVVLDTCRNRGTAAIQSLSQGINFSITDRDTSDSCGCRAGNPVLSIP